MGTAGPVLTQVPGVNADLRGVARNLMTPEIAQGSFDGGAEGLQAVGNAIAGLGEVGQRVGNIIADSRERLADYQDSVSLASYDRRMSEEFEKYKAELPGVTESEWLPGWQAKYKEISTKIASEYKFSGNGMQRLALANEQFLQQTNVNLIRSASQSAFTRGNGELMAKAQRDFDSGNFEEAHATLGKMVDTGAIGADDAQRQVDQWKESMLEADMIADPDGLIQGIEDGSVSVPEDRKARLISDANKVKRQQIGAAIDELDQMIFSGKFKTKEEIEEFSSIRGIPAKDTFERVKSLSIVEPTTIEGKARLESEYLKLMADIESYDPKFDVEEKGLYDLRTRIINLPPGYGEEPSGILSGIVREGRKTSEQEIRGNISSNIISMKSAGFFGVAPKEKGKKAGTEALLIEQRASALMDQFRAYQQQMGAKLTQADADAWLSAQTIGDIKKAVGDKSIKSPTAKITTWGADGVTFVEGASRKKTQAELMAEVEGALELPKK